MKQLAQKKLNYMGDYLIFFKKVENHGYIYMAELVPWFLRPMVMNPKNLPDNYCQGLFQWWRVPDLVG